MENSENLTKVLRRAYARRDVVAVESAPVYDGDDFAFTYGLEPHLHHVPKDVTQTLTYAWAIVTRRVGNSTVKVFAVSSAEEWGSMDPIELQVLAIDRAVFLLPEEEGDDEA